MPRADLKADSRPQDRYLPPVLIELAAGRNPGAVEIDTELLRVAREHRMTGLLWTWARDHLSDSDLKKRLAMHDLAVQAHLVRVWNALEASVKRLEDVGIEVATIKGVTAEARWYSRPGERPCSDVDLLLAPHQLDRVREAAAALQPDHPWLPHLDALAASGRIQTVTLRVDGLEVDLHFDLLKLGIPTQQSATLWARTCSYLLPGGDRVRVLDDTAALFHLLVHLNKDRFQRLLGFADIQRIVSACRVDWPRLVQLARGEGIEVPVLRSLDVVLTELYLPWPTELPRPRGPRAILWNLLWRRDIRLRGWEGRVRYRMRQNWIALSARGRAKEALWFWMRDLWPPAEAVEFRYANVKGPYLWKLFFGRIRTTIGHRREVYRLRGNETDRQ